MNRQLLPAATCLILSLLLAACTGSSAWQASEAALAGDPVAMWQDGQEAIRRGEDQIRRGEALIREGQNVVSEGEAMISEGNTFVSRSREQYRVTARTAGGALTPEQLEEEAERLRRIARDWDQALDQIERGNRRISEGNNQISDGQKVVREGQTLIASGQNLLRNSEMIRREQDAQSGLPADLPVELTPPPAANL